MSHYDYHDKDGNLVGTFNKFPVPRCPVCRSDKLKDKGSFSKCLVCGKRIVDSVFQPTVGKEGEGDN